MWTWYSVLNIVQGRVYWAIYKVKCTKEGALGRGYKAVYKIWCTRQE